MIGWSTPAGGAPSGRAHGTGRLKSFFADFTEGFTTDELRRLVGRDARQAYRVITREQDLAAEPRGRLRRLFFRAKIVFLGLSYKLTPARRVLFGVAILAAVLGLFRFNATVESQRITVDFSPFWFLFSVSSLVFLLALELVDRVLVRDELEVARQLQRDLLPSAAPAIAGYEVAHSYRTANEIGGDYYDFLEMPGGKVALVVADASGHGMAAGLLMAIANAALKLAVEVDPTPERVATLLNRVLYRTGDARSFMTLFYAVLDPPTGRFSYVCVGHPFPLLRRAGGETVELGTGGFPLGIRETLEITDHEASLEPGDLLVLYSDGLPEAVSATGDAFGYDAVRVLLRQPGGAREVHDRILAALDGHRSQEPLKDDVTVVVVARV
ncbi:MAG TPA: PP2C family protein-serine/threonine phosphatase [Thermoanaerobaculaceae bacterium]|nr:PP2C family protein-serine/threonine phosphatase [Thermoanaerobaculaceae bacterium]